MTNGVFHSMLSIARARSSMIFDARKSLRRCTIVTFSANFARKIASSIAESPPPTMIVCLFLKNAASQVAQYETPRPESSSSPRTSSFLCSAPIASTTVRALVDVVADDDLVDAAGLVGELDRGGLVGEEARAEALGLVAHRLHELRAHDPLGEAGVVLDLGRLLEQAAPEEALDDEGLEVRAGGVQRGGVAGRPAADDDDVLDPVAHGAHFI